VNTGVLSPFWGVAPSNIDHYSQTFTFSGDAVLPFRSHLRAIGLTLVALELFVLAGCAGPDFITSKDLRSLDDVSNCADLDSFTSALDALLEAHVVGADYVARVRLQAAEMRVSFGC
jgi:hypothetical protein